MEQGTEFILQGNQEREGGGQPSPATWELGAGWSRLEGRGGNYWGVFHGSVCDPGREL